MLFLKGQLHPRVEFREKYIYFSQNVYVEYKNPFPYLGKKEIMRKVTFSFVCLLLYFRVGCIVYWEAHRVRPARV